MILIIENIENELRKNFAINEQCIERGAKNVE